MKDPKIYNEEIVRNEMFLLLDYYPTESSGHNSEYNAWFRKRPDLIEKFCAHGTGWNPGVYAYILNEYLNQKNTWQKGIEDWLNEPNVNLNRGHEYAAYIFNAMFGDKTLFKFNGNVLNKGLIENLPQGACVEVPVLASPHGFEAIKVYQAIAFDPLTSAVLGIQEIKEMTRKMFKQNAAWLPKYGDLR